MRYNHSPEARSSGNLGRIAIWNKAKVIFAIAMGLWIADNGVFIYGKYSVQITGESLVYLVIS
jgi:hypothetical protein